ncbi:hypothetical protein [Escherichia coli]|uniref:hypothetical protein n=1 Tax=Escherichia coli TaxID=562 RepID=UPI003890AD46
MTNTIFMAVLVGELTVNVTITAIIWAALTASTNDFLARWTCCRCSRPTPRSYSGRAAIFCHVPDWHWYRHGTQPQNGGKQ